MPNPPEARQLGRPPAEIDMDQLAALCRMKPTLHDAAAFFKCSERTIQRAIREKYDMDWKEFREQSMVHTKFDLIRKAIKKAEDNDTMHIFCLKNLCDWSDKQDHKLEHSGDVTHNLNISRVDLEERVKQIKGEE